MWAILMQRQSVPKVLLALLTAGLLAACGVSRSPDVPQASGAPRAALPAYQPELSVAGTIRVWGSPADAALIERLQAGFARLQPNVRFSNTLHGPESTLAGVYTDSADIAFMARELRLPMESMAFQWVKLGKPFQLEVATAGLAGDRPSANLAVLVHEDNPLRQLTLTQLDAVLGTEHRRGAAVARHWGDLGLEQGWTSQPIHVYGPHIDSIPAQFIRRVVMKDSYKWNPAYVELPSDDEVVAALAKDPLGIAYAPLRPGNGKVKALALAADDAGPFHALDRESLAARTYPLARAISMVVSHTPEHPMEPKVREFLRYVVSAEGQAIVERDGSFIPLSAEVSRRELARLEASP